MQILKIYLCFSGALAFLTSTNICGQEADRTLSFNDSIRRIENIISIYTSESNLERIRDTTGVKVKVAANLAIINNDTVKIDEISTRGQSTLHYRRKSFTFDLGSEASFCHGEKTESLNNFYVLSLSMDKNYCSNRLAFGMMEASGLFGLFYSYCDMLINGQNEGIHLVVERPTDWAVRYKQCPLLIRRGYNETIDKTEGPLKNKKDEVKKYSAVFRQIYKSLNKYKGETLYDTISRKLDLDLYMKWLAFNFLIKNGDYTDEVYFYFDPGMRKFSIIPWDYDDIFLLTPHEGFNEHKKILSGKLIFSAEDLLDKKIASDPYLYRIYLVKFRELLDQLSSDLLKKVFEETYAELYPNYSSDEIISLSRYDAYKNANLERLKGYLQSVYESLLIEIDFYHNYLSGNQ